LILLAVGPTVLLTLAISNMVFKSRVQPGFRLSPKNIIASQSSQSSQDTTKTDVASKRNSQWRTFSIPPKELMRKKKAIRFLILMTAVFAICWTPYLVLKLVQTCHASSLRVQNIHSINASGDNDSDDKMEKGILISTTNNVLEGNLDDFLDLENQHKLTMLYDKLDLYFFALWTLHPVFIAVVHFITSKTLRKSLLAFCRCGK